MTQNLGWFSNPIYWAICRENSISFSKFRKQHLLWYSKTLFLHNINSKERSIWLLSINTCMQHKHTHTYEEMICTFLVIRIAVIGVRICEKCMSVCLFQETIYEQWATSWRLSSSVIWTKFMKFKPFFFSTLYKKKAFHEGF